MPFKLSSRSLKALEGVHPDLVAVVKRAIQITPVDFVVIEYKFDAQGMSGTIDGRQMSDSWIRGDLTGTNRVLEAVGGDQRLADQVQDAMRNGRIEKWKINVKPDGSTEVRVLDGRGYVLPVSKSGSKILCGRPDGKC